MFLRCSFLACFVATLVAVIITMTTATATSAPTDRLLGSYKLIELGDQNSNSIYLPNQFSVHIDPDEFQAGNNNAGTDTSYRVYIKVGNSLSTKVTLKSSLLSTGKGEVQVEFGGVSSTMMMPPAELYTVETALTQIFPVVDTLEYAEDGLLTWRGPLGYLVIQPVNE